MSQWSPRPRPEWVMAMNRVGANAGDPAFSVALDEDSLLGAACEATGLDDFGDVLASARHTRIGVVLDFGDDEITLLGVNASQLHADDFLI